MSIVIDSDSNVGIEEEVLSAEEQQEYDEAEAAFNAEFTGEEPVESEPKTEELEDVDVELVDEEVIDAELDEEEEEDPEEEEESDPEVEEPDEEESEEESAEEPKAEAETVSKKDYDLLAKRLRNIESKFGHLDNTVKKQAKSAKEPKKKLELKAGDKFKNLQDEYSEIGDGVKDAVESSMEAVQSEFNEILDSKFDSNEFATAKEFDDFKQDLTIKMKHRKWKDDINSPKFGVWLGTQDNAYQAEAIKTTDPFEIIDIIDKFKSSQETKAKKVKSNSKRLRSSTTPTKGKSAQGRKQQSAEDAFAEGFKTG